MADSDPVLYERRGAVAVLTLNRPDRLNAWTGAMGECYFDSLDRASADSEVRAIVVTGAGRGFCAGADMAGLQAMGTSSTDRARATGPSRPTWYATTVPKPLIAAINGACAGVGLVHALMCDIRFAAAGAKFTTAFARRGLVAEHGISWVLPRLVGPARALDLLLSGRTFVSEEAHELGLVNDVVPAEHIVDHAVDYATELATYSSPASMAMMKAQVWGDLTKTLAEAASDALPLMAVSLEAADFREGVQSYLEKRAPNFAPLRA